MLDWRLATATEIVGDIGARVRARRLGRLITQQELADRAGASIGALKTLESTGLCTLLTWVRVLQALSLTDEIADILRPRPSTSIADMERAVLATRKRARRSAKR